MQERAAILLQFVRLLDDIEGRKTEEREIEVKLKDGSILKLVVIFSEKSEKIGLKLVKPS